jgi:3,4-dihydroxy-9,10-secoandrosta-1,3,5(10)-triene-9,17-dione 4,5-dioxygenase
MINISGLAYVVAETTDLAQWKRYAEGVLGMMTAPSPDGGLYVRMDERQFRFAVQPGARDAYVVSGWEVPGRADFDDALRILREAGVEVTQGDAAQCRLRCVQQVAGFADPSGNRHELVWGFRSDFAHFASPAGVSRFVTGNIGMGHTVLPAPEFEKTVEFFTQVMGFGLSDLMNFQPAGPDGPNLPIHFFHCNNARHHSLALAGFPVESGCVHVMVEVERNGIPVPMCRCRTWLTTRPRLSLSIQFFLKKPCWPLNMATHPMTQAPWSSGKRSSVILPMALRW